MKILIISEKKTSIVFKLYKEKDCFFHINEFNLWKKKMGFQRKVKNGVKRKSPQKKKKIITYYSCSQLKHTKYNWKHFYIVITKWKN